MEKNNQSLILGIVVISAVLIITLALILRSGDDSNIPTTATDSETTKVVEPDPDSKSPPDSSTEPTSTIDDEPESIPNPEVQPDPETIETELPSGDREDNLPSDWDELTSAEKTDLNPYRCLEGAIIRSDNGRCVIADTSINYILLDKQGPQAYTPPLIVPTVIYTSIGVPNDTTDEDMDKVFEHFKADVAERRFGGSFPAVVSPLKAVIYILDIHYYDDFVFNSDAYHGLEFLVDWPDSRKSYKLTPAYTLGVFGYAGYTRDDVQAARVIDEAGRNGTLPEGCTAAIDIALVYGYDPAHRGEGFRSGGESVDSIYHYGSDNPTGADFKEIFIDNDGALQAEIRTDLLQLVHVRVPEDADLETEYDFLIKFYRYDDVKRFDFAQYGEADLFDILPEISVVECSDNM